MDSSSQKSTSKKTSDPSTTLHHRQFIETPPPSIFLDLIPPTNPFPCFQLEIRKRKRSSDDHDHDVVVKSPPLIIEKKKKRCSRCSKKVGLIGYKCMCGEIFCGVHRHPEEHHCEFDFKIFGKVVLIKENPLCIGDKLKFRV